MKNKGFTLVELLTMLVVLGILMLVAVPNITGIIDSHKTNLIINDASKMLDNAKVKVTQNKSITKPKNGECVSFSLQYVDDGENIVKGPNEGEYNRYESFILMKRENTKYYYYIRLVEEREGKTPYGIHLKTAKDLEDVSNVSTVSLIGLEKIPELDVTRQYSNDEEGNNERKSVMQALLQEQRNKIASNIAKLNGNSDVTSICNNRVINYY